MRVLLSIKKSYADKIFSGEKKYEYRKKIFQREVSTIVVYVTKPVGMIIGEFSVESVLNEEPSTIWSKTKQHSGIDAYFFFTYFAGRSKGYAIKIGNILMYDTPINPQTWIAYMTGRNAKAEANLLLEKFPQLNKEFRQFATGKMTIDQADEFLKKVEKLEDGLESVSGTQLLRETFFDALSGIHNGIPGLTKNNPGLATFFTTVRKDGPKALYLKSMQWNISKILGDDLAMNAIK